MPKFNYELGQEVRMVMTSERGFVIGRAEYQHSENCYYVRYAAADGRQVEAWWNESALIGAD